MFAQNTPKASKKPHTAIVVEELNIKDLIGEISNMSPIRTTGIRKNIQLDLFIH